MRTRPGGPPRQPFAGAVRPAAHQPPAAPRCEIRSVRPAMTWKTLMNRRDCVLAMAAGVALAHFPATVLAQAASAGFVEGRDYLKLDKPLPVSPGKIEVVEFFGYWCPHCNAFEPALEAWVRKLPADQVNFRRVPVAFGAAQEPLQKLYFALESLGLVESLHGKVFAAIHVQKMPMSKESDIAAWAQANGADPTKILDAMKSFSVATKTRQARQLADGYAIDGVPTLGIQGRFRTAPSIAGSGERALAATDALIAQLRKG